MRFQKAVSFFVSALLLAACADEQKPSPRKNVPTTDDSVMRGATSAFCSDLGTSESCATNTTCRWQNNACMTYRGVECSSVVNQAECISPCGWINGKCEAVPSSGEACATTTSQAACQSSQVCLWLAGSSRCIDKSVDSCSNRMAPADCTSLAIGTQCFWSAQANACQSFSAPTEQCRLVAYNDCSRFQGCVKNNNVCVAQGQEKPNPVLTVVATVLSGIFQKVVQDHPQMQSILGGGVSNLIFGFLGVQPPATQSAPILQQQSTEPAAQPAQPVQPAQPEQQAPQG